MKIKFFLWLLVVYTLDVRALDWFGTALNTTPCTGNSQGHGPFDYLQVVTEPNSAIARNSRLWEVDKIHYAKGISILRAKGLNEQSFKLVQSEFDYTLRAFPNHLKALYAVINLELQRLEKNKHLENQIPALKTPPECYLQRALVFRPKQPQIYQLYAIYLQKLQMYEAAQRYYESALELDAFNAESHYNYGLLLFEMKKFDKARQHAQKAESLHFPLQGLKSMLVEAGHW